MSNAPLSRFILIEHQDGEKVVIRVHYVGQPRMMVEFTPRMDGEGNITGGTLKRVCCENCWDGNTRKVNKLVSQAEKFFLRSLEDEAPTHRLKL